MSAAYPNQADAETSILSAMEFTSTYSFDDIERATLPFFTEFLENSLESLVAKGFLTQNGAIYSMTWKGNAEKLRCREAKKRRKRALNRNARKETP